MTQKLILHCHGAGPNPFKVAIILEELGVPYDLKNWEMADLKSEEYLALNPNGRVPALEDPNQPEKFVIWESAAIITYILETYDTENKLTPTDFKTKWAALSWRDFQISGQGPYTGQALWFMIYHPEKIQSAIDRYKNEAVRMIGVIDYHLAKTGFPYLTGDKITYADLMFAPYYQLMDMTTPADADIQNKFLHFSAWWTRIRERPVVEKIWVETQKRFSGKK